MPALRGEVTDTRSPSQLEVEARCHIILLPHTAVNLGTERLEGGIPRGWRAARTACPGLTYEPVRSQCVVIHLYLDPLGLPPQLQVPVNPLDTLLRCRA